MDWQYRITKVLVTSLIVFVTSSNLISAQEVDRCISAPCQNGAPCFTIEDSFFCYCEGSSYFGRFCENPIQDCPPDLPPAICFVDLCASAICPGRRDATCRPNYCGQCSADFYDAAGNVVDCNCPPDRPEVECLVNPCDGATCPGRTDATCRPNYCGECSADFYDSTGNIVDCACPVSSPAVVGCTLDPCDGAQCASRPSAECRSDSCGACNVAFFEGEIEATGCRRVDCPAGEEPVNCLVDPCEVTRCDSDPSARCVPNYCGGCTAQYYNAVGERVQCGPCDSSPCANNGICGPMVNSFICFCSPGFTGRTCEQIDPCDPPCANGGTCTRSGESTYTCTCPMQYVGADCTRANLCFPSPCSNGGTCSLTSDLTPFCTCPDGFTGSLCTTEVDNCAIGMIRCENGGTCRSSGLFAYCECPPGYSGAQCEQRLEPCDSGPCQNQGVCLNAGPGLSIDYLCICMMGYTGENCGTPRDICDSLPCRNRGTCMEVTTNGGTRSFVCQCPVGYAGPTCEIIDDDPCSLLPCVNGFCFNITSSLGFCVCSPGFMGSACDIAVNPCADLVCQNGGSCLVEEGSARCECAAGFAGDNCHILFSPCAVNRCFNQGTCRPDISALRGYVCECPDMFEGDNCQSMITNPCFPDPCVNGFCVISNTDTTQAVCLCQTGYTGLTCDLPLDPCSSVPCLNGGRCLTFGSSNGYFCNCTESYMGERCEQRVLCSPNPCFNGGSCRRTAGTTGFSCRCPTGFTGDRCQVILDPCLNNFCVNGACVPFQQGYRCVCQEGYTGVACDEPDGCPLSCPDDITLPAPLDQQFYQVSWDLPDTICGYRTAPSPPPGSYFGRGESFVQVSFLDASGASVDQCTFSITIGEDPAAPPCEANPCQNQGTCVNLQGTLFACLCPDTFNGQYCENSLNTDPCSSLPCLNDGICFYIPDTAMGYLCGCREGFMGARCEIPDDACARAPCVNAVTCSSQSAESYSCLCVQGFGGRDCDVPLSCFSAPCQNGGECSELGAEGFSCTCPPGYRGEACQQVDRCISGPCLNGGTCVSSGDSFQCLCFEGYSGRTCGFIDQECTLECPEDIVRTVGATTSIAQVSWEHQQAVCGIPVMFTFLPGSSFPLGATVVRGVMQTSDILRQCSFTVLVVQADPCDSTPCENNGRCMPVAGSFTCQCTMGYMGTRCETTSTPEVSEACSSDPCQNEATCFGNEENYFCVCTTDFSGPQCAQPVTRDPCESQPCSNGGTCINLEGRFVCICLEGYGGPVCADEVMVDVTAPRLDFCPSNIAVVALLQVGGANVFWNEPRATDDSGSTQVASQNRRSGSFFPFGNTTVVYDIEDPANNSVLCVFMVSVRVEMLEPTCMPECPADISVVTDSDMDFTRVFWSLSSMSCNYTVVSSHRPGNFFRVGDEVVDVEFMDGRDTVYTCSFTISVIQGFRNFCGLRPCQNLGTCQDLVDGYECICPQGFAGRNCEDVTSVDEVRPVISFCPPDVSVRTLIGSGTVPATWRNPRAVDDSGTVILSDQSHSPGDDFGVGVTTVSYEFCDPSGNKAICQFRVIVESADQCKILCPENINKFAEEGVSFIEVTWDQPERMCGYPVSSSPLPGSFFPLGQNLVIVMTVDDSGDVIDRCSFSVTIRLATQGNPCDDPTTCGTGECILDSSVGEGYRCECTRCFTGDYCERALPIRNPCSSDMENLCENGGTCSFVDCNFTCTCTERYTGSYCQIERVNLDTTPPILVGCPVDITSTVGEFEEGAVVTWEKVRYFDTSGTAYFAGTNHASGDFFPLGLTEVTMIYGDASLNFEYCIFNVNVQPVNSQCNPNICPDDIRLLNRGSLEYMEVFWVQVHEVCGYTVVSDVPSGYLFPVGTTPVVWRMYDAGNMERAGCTFSVMIIDEFSNPCNKNPCESDSQCVPNANTADSYDCVCAPGVFQCSTGQNDVVPPSVERCNNQEAKVELGEADSLEFTWVEPIVSDNAGAFFTERSLERPHLFPLGTTPVYYTYEDTSGNSATCNLTITIEELDTQAPMIYNCTTDTITVIAPAGFAYHDVTYPEPYATDNSNIVVTEVEPPNLVSGGSFQVREKIHPVGWTFTDASGNKAECLIKINVLPFGSTV